MTKFCCVIALMLLQHANVLCKASKNEQSTDRIKRGFRGPVFDEVSDFDDIVEPRNQNHDIPSSIIIRSLHENEASAPKTDEAKNIKTELKAKRKATTQATKLKQRQVSRSAETHNLKFELKPGEQHKSRSNLKDNGEIWKRTNEDFQNVDVRAHHRQNYQSKTSKLNQNFTKPCITTTIKHSIQEYPHKSKAVSWSDLYKNSVEESYDDSIGQVEPVNFKNIMKVKENAENESESFKSSPLASHTENVTEWKLKPHQMPHNSKVKTAKKPSSGSQSSVMLLKSEQISIASISDSGDEEQQNPLLKRSKPKTVQEFLQPVDGAVMKKPSFEQNGQPNHEQLLEFQNPMFPLKTAQMQLQAKDSVNRDFQQIENIATKPENQIENTRGFWNKGNDDYQSNNPLELLFQTPKENKVYETHKLTTEKLQQFGSKHFKEFLQSKDSKAKNDHYKIKDQTLENSQSFGDFKEGVKPMFPDKYITDERPQINIISPLEKMAIDEILNNFDNGADKSLQKDNEKLKKYEIIDGVAVETKKPRTLNSNHQMNNPLELLFRTPTENQDHDNFFNFEKRIENPFKIQNLQDSLSRLNARVDMSLQNNNKPKLEILKYRKSKLTPFDRKNTYRNIPAALKRRYLEKADSATFKSFIPPDDLEIKKYFLRPFYLRKRTLPARYRNSKGRRRSRHFPRRLRRSLIKQKIFPSSKPRTRKGVRKSDSSKTFSISANDLIAKLNELENDVKRSLHVRNSHAGQNKIDDATPRPISLTISTQKAKREDKDTNESKNYLKTAYNLIHQLEELEETAHKDLKLHHDSMKIKNVDSTTSTVVKTEATTHKSKRSEIDESQMYLLNAYRLMGQLEELQKDLHRNLMIAYVSTDADLAVGTTPTLTASPKETKSPAEFLPSETTTSSPVESAISPPNIVAPAVLPNNRAAQTASISARSVIPRIQVQVNPELLQKIEAIKESLQNAMHPVSLVELNVPQVQFTESEDQASQVAFKKAVSTSTLAPTSVSTSVSTEAPINPVLLEKLKELKESVENVADRVAAIKQNEPISSNRFGIQGFQSAVKPFDLSLYNSIQTTVQRPMLQGNKLEIPKLSPSARDLTSPLTMLQFGSPSTSRSTFQSELLIRTERATDNPLWWEDLFVTDLNKNKKKKSSEYRKNKVNSEKKAVIDSIFESKANKKKLSDYENKGIERKTKNEDYSYDDYDYDDYLNDKALDEKQPKKHIAKVLDPEDAKYRPRLLQRAVDLNDLVECTSTMLEELKTQVCQHNRTLSLETVEKIMEFLKIIQSALNNSQYQNSNPVLTTAYHNTTSETQSLPLPSPNTQPQSVFKLTTETTFSVPLNYQPQVTNKLSAFSETNQIHQTINTQTTHSTQNLGSEITTGSSTIFLASNKTSEFRHSYESDLTLSNKLFQEILKNNSLALLTHVLDYIENIKGALNSTSNLSSIDHVNVNSSLKNITLKHVNDSSIKHSTIHTRGVVKAVSDEDDELGSLKFLKTMQVTYTTSSMKFLRAMQVTQTSPTCHRETSSVEACQNYTEPDVQTDNPQKNYTEEDVDVILKALHNEIQSLRQLSIGKPLKSLSTSSDYNQTTLLTTAHSIVPSSPKSISSSKSADLSTTANVSTLTSITSSCVNFFPQPSITLNPPPSSNETSHQLKFRKISSSTPLHVNSVLPLKSTTPSVIRKEKSIILLQALTDKINSLKKQKNQQTKSKRGSRNKRSMTEKNSAIQVTPCANQTKTENGLEEVTLPKSLMLELEEIENNCSTAFDNILTSTESSTEQSKFNTTAATNLTALSNSTTPLFFVNMESFLSSTESAAFELNSVTPLQVVPECILKSVDKASNEILPKITTEAALFSLKSSEAESVNNKSTETSISTTAKATPPLSKTSKVEPLRNKSTETNTVTSTTYSTSIDKRPHTKSNNTIISELKLLGKTHQKGQNNLLASNSSTTYVSTSTTRSTSETKSFDVGLNNTLELHTISCLESANSSLALNGNLSLSNKFRRVASSTSTRSFTSQPLSNASNVRKEFPREPPKCLLKIEEDQCHCNKLTKNTTKPPCKPQKLKKRSATSPTALTECTDTTTAHTTTTENVATLSECNSTTTVHTTTTENTTEIAWLESIETPEEESSNKRFITPKSENDFNFMAASLPEYFDDYYDEDTSTNTIQRLQRDLDAAYELEDILNKVRSSSKTKDEFGKRNVRSVTPTESSQDVLKIIVSDQSVGDKTALDQETPKQKHTKKHIHYGKKPDNKKVALNNQNLYRPRNKIYLPQTDTFYDSSLISQRFKPQKFPNIEKLFVIPEKKNLDDTADCKSQGSYENRKRKRFLFCKKRKKLFKRKKKKKFWRRLFGRKVPGLHNKNFLNRGTQNF